MWPLGHSHWFRKVFRVVAIYMRVFPLMKLDMWPLGHSHWFREKSFRWSPFTCEYPRLWKVNVTWRMFSLVQPFRDKSSTSPLQSTTIPTGDLSSFNLWKDPPEWPRDCRILWSPTRSIDEINEKVLVQSGRSEPKRDPAGLHRDSPQLLILATVHVSEWRKSPTLREGMPVRWLLLLLIARGHILWRGFGSSLASDIIDATLRLFPHP